MNDNRCVICGAVIPEGRMVCGACQREIDKKIEERESDVYENRKYNEVKK